MSKVTRRQVIRAGVAAGAALSAGTANAAPEKEKPFSFVDRFLPMQLTNEDIQASNGWGRLATMNGPSTAIALTSTWLRCCAELSQAQHNRSMRKRDSPAVCTTGGDEESTAGGVEKTRRSSCARSTPDDRRHHP